MIDKNRVMAKIVFNDGTSESMPLSPSQVFNMMNLLLDEYGASEVISLNGDDVRRHTIGNGAVEKIELTRMIIAGGED